MRRAWGLMLGGAALALIGARLAWPQPVWATGVTGLALAVLAAALLATRAKSKVIGVMIGILGVAIVASAVAGGWAPGPGLSGLGGGLCALGGVLSLWAKPARWPGQGKLEAKPDDAWARFSAGDDPTDDSEPVA